MWKVNTRRLTPIWGAASPTPGASSMVSVRSLTSLRSSASKTLTGSAGVRSTGSLKSRIGLMLMAHRPFGWAAGCGGDGPGLARVAPAGSSLGGRAAHERVLRRPDDGDRALNAALRA